MHVVHVLEAVVLTEIPEISVPWKAAVLRIIGIRNVIRNTHELSMLPDLTMTHVAKTHKSVCHHAALRLEP